MIPLPGTAGRSHRDAAQARSVGAGRQTKPRSTARKASLLTAAQRRKSPLKQLRGDAAGPGFNPFDRLAAAEDIEASQEEPAQVSALTEAHFRRWGNDYRAADRYHRIVTARYNGYSSLRQRQSPHPELPCRTEDGGWILYTAKSRYVYSLDGKISFSPIAQSSAAGDRVTYDELPKSIRRQDTPFYGEWRAAVRQKRIKRRTGELNSMSPRRSLGYFDDGDERLTINRFNEEPLLSYFSRFKREARERAFGRESFRRETYERREPLAAIKSFYGHEYRRADFRPRRGPPGAYSADHRSGDPRPRRYEYDHSRSIVNLFVGSPFRLREKQAIKLWEKPERPQQQLESSGFSEDHVFSKEAQVFAAKNHQIAPAHPRQKRGSKSGTRPSREQVSTGPRHAQTEKLLAYIGAVSYPGLCGPQSLSAWRHGAGRKKDWRGGRSIKSSSKRATERLRAPKNRPFHDFHDWQDYEWSDISLDFDEDMIDDTEMTPDWVSQSTRFEAEDISFLTPRGKGYTRIGLPSSKFNGAVIGSMYRLTQYLRSEDHGDVFVAEDLSGTSQRYEVRSFSFKGISRSLHDYRRRNLKKIAGGSNFVRFVKHGGKIYAFTRTSDAESRNVSRSTRQRSGIGAIGRRNTPEFNAAFPPLPGHSKTQSPSQGLAAAEFLMKTDSDGTLWISLRTQHNDTARIDSKADPVKVQLAASQRWQEIQTMYAKPNTESGQITLHVNQSEASPRKLKTEQQLERQRVKQRDWRARKRAKKGACAAPMAAESPPNAQEGEEPAPNIKIHVQLPTSPPALTPEIRLALPSSASPNPPAPKAQVRLPEPKPRVHLPPSPQPAEVEKSEDDSVGKDAPTATDVNLESDFRAQLADTSRANNNNFKHIMQTLANIQDLVDSQRKILDDSNAKAKARREEWQNPKDPVSAGFRASLGVNQSDDKPAVSSVPTVPTSRRKLTALEADLYYPRPAGMPQVSDNYKSTKRAPTFVRDLVSTWNERAEKERADGERSRKAPSSRSDPMRTDVVGSNHRTPSIVPKSVWTAQNDTLQESQVPSSARTALSTPSRPKNPLHKELRYRAELQKRGFFLSGSDFFDK